MTSPQVATRSRPRERDDPLSLVSLFAYLIPGVGVSFLFMLVLVMYMNFATDVLLVAPGIMGGIFLLARLWDAISDPVAGYLSDRTRSRLGRRRSWMLASSVPIAIFAVVMWAPPSRYVFGSGSRPGCRAEPARR